ncbi:MAG: hypothetical protein KA371_07250 [Acidobacteria bacterium]|nr:hypothetical protein [Acidobacteriota bacterium]
MTSRPSPFLAGAVALLAFGLLGNAVGARDTLMSVADVRPGMVGVGRTVFKGAAIEEFTVRIIGTLKSVVAPQRDLILAKLEGGPLADTGVIAGMSGSPVYIDGKLLGAISYQLGQFPKEPIAGITPILEMTDATALGAARALKPVSLPLGYPVPASDLVPLWRAALTPPSPFSAATGDLLGLAVSAGLPHRMSLDLRPITVPMTAGGFADGAIERLAPGLPGVSIVTTQASQTAASPTAPLAPGDAIGVALLSGDFSIGATGTVTHVDGAKVYAFGHPLYNLGPTAFPMTRANVIAVLPSLVTSSKLASLGPVVGTISQDRATAIAGHLGAPPPLVPVSVTLTSKRAPSRTFSFQVVNDELFTPLLTYLAVANVLTSYERQTGAATYGLTGEARIVGQAPIRFADVFVGDQGAADAAAYVAAPLTVLYRNATERFSLEGITLAIEADEETRTAEIDRVWIDEPTVRAGRALPVQVQLRTFQGEDRLISQSIDIPANATGTLQLIVSDGPRLGRQDARGRAEMQPVSQIVRAANRQKHNHHVYLRLTSSAPGAVVGGEAMPGLPPSVAGIIEADKGGSGTSTLRTTPRGEWAVAVPFAVSGSRQITIAVDPD